MLKKFQQCCYCWKKFNPLFAKLNTHLYIKMVVEISQTYK